MVYFYSGPLVCFYSGVDIEFPSAGDGVNCAIKVQDALAGHETIKLRIGLHIGDVTFEDEDIFGDGVNVAARLQEICEPGALVISDVARRSIDGKLGRAFNNLGAQQLKNIAEPVALYGWRMARAEVDGAELALPDKPSIAVLPFDNMSGDPEQEYFSDGIAEDVITALSRFRSLFVIARNSSFAYKDKAMAVTQIARELGVRYVVQGSVRKASSRVRINAHLVDAMTSNQLWADRFDRALDDVFALQDEITEQIVVAVEPEIAAHERERARRKPPAGLDAWELVQRGLSHFHRVNKCDNAKARRLFEEAVSKDPEFAFAHAQLAYALWTSSVWWGGVADKDKVLETGRAAAEKAIFLDSKESMAHFVLGRIYAADGEADMAIREMQTAISHNPNFALGYYGLGFAYHALANQTEQGLSYYETALRLSPRDPMRWTMLMMTGSALRELNRHDEAIMLCPQACQYSDAGSLPHIILASALAEAGRVREAQREVEKTARLEPALSISFIRKRFSHLHENYLENLINALRKAGVSD